MRVEVNASRLFIDVEGAKFVADGDTMREKPTVVLLHGGPGFDHSNFKPEYSQLSDVAQLVYLDHRGNGRSDYGDPNSWNLDVWADDVKGLCDTLEIAHPIVLGWSFGGMVAMHYAARYPDHPSKLILQSTAARMELDRIAEGFGALGGEEAAAAARAFWERHDPSNLGPYVEHCLPLYHSESTEIQMARCVLNYDLLVDGFAGWREMDLRPGLGQLQIPVLVLNGDEDPITPVSAAAEIVASLESADVTLEVFAQAGHFIHLSQPELFFAAIRSFILD